MINNRFSVLMSVYLKENHIFLREALESIYFKQSLKPNEIVIVKDGSLNEDLDAVLEEYKQKLPDVVKIVGYENNRGLGYALNYGLNECTNEIICRMDSDDISVPDRFKIQIKRFEENDDLVILGSNIEEFDQKPGDLKRERKVYSLYSDIIKNMYLKSPFNHMTVVFKKTLVQKAGGYEDIFEHEDHHLWIRILKKFYGENIDENLVLARTGNDLIGRRHGLLSFKREIDFQNSLIQRRLINMNNYLINILFRALPKLLPKKILGIIYDRILRKSFK